MQRLPPATIRMFMAALMDTTTTGMAVARHSSFHLQHHIGLTSHAGHTYHDACHRPRLGTSHVQHCGTWHAKHLLQFMVKISCMFVIAGKQAAADADYNPKEGADAKGKRAAPSPGGKNVRRRTSDISGDTSGDSDEVESDEDESEAESEDDESDAISEESGDEDSQLTGMSEDDSEDELDVEIAMPGMSL